MKKAEYKELSVADLQNKLAELQAELTKLKITHAISPLENPMLIRKVRRSVATLMTELNSRKNTVQ
ncbi:MAG TPA: 50S ribosomal protein L29 [Bacteroidia bacterium]